MHTWVATDQLTAADLNGNFTYVQTLITAAEKNITVFGGDGSDGALSISSGTTTIDLANADVFIKQYSSISITGTGKLAFSNPGTNGTIIIFLCSGNFTVTTSGTPAIDLTGIGAAAGTDGIGLYYGPTAGTSIASNNGSGGTSVTGYKGGRGVHMTATYAKRRFPNVFAGAGGTTGSRTSGAGGRGGGGFYCEIFGAINFTATIDASGIAGAAGTGSASNYTATNGNGGGSNTDGGDGSQVYSGGTHNDGGCGGGGAGSVIIHYKGTATAVSGTITVTAGAGGSGGGATGGTGISQVALVPFMAA